MQPTPGIEVHTDGIHEVVKPTLRGVFHQIGFFLALVAGAVLVWMARTPRAAVMGFIYAVSLALMYALSAAYHRPKWGPRALDLMRRFDHAGIYLLIAGSYTPVAALGIPGTQGQVLLYAAWSFGVLGVVHSLFFLNAFRKLNALLYVLFGLIAVPALPQMVAGLGPVRCGLVVAGGVVYILGAVVYGRRWPNPVPRHFGYHEVFHVMVVLASALHYGAMLSLVQVVPGAS